MKENNRSRFFKLRGGQRRLAVHRHFDNSWVVYLYVCLGNHRNYIFVGPGDNRHEAFQSLRKEIQQCREAVEVCGIYKGTY